MTKGTFDTVCIVVLFLSVLGMLIYDKGFISGALHMVITCAIGLALYFIHYFLRSFFF